MFSAQYIDERRDIFSALQDRMSSFVAFLHDDPFAFPPIHDLHSKWAARTAPSVIERPKTLNAEDQMLDEIESQIAIARQIIQRKRRSYVEAVAPIRYIPNDILHRVMTETRASSYRGTQHDDRQLTVSVPRPRDSFSKTDPCIDMTRANRTVAGFSLVCRLWRNVAVNSPSLWTRLDLGWPPQLFQTWVLRSAPLPIDLYDTGTHSRGDVEGARRLVDTLALALQSSSRWRSAHLNISTASQRYLTALLGASNTFPILEKLYFHPISASMLNACALASVMPRLGILHLHRLIVFSADWYMVAENLVELTICLADSWQDGRINARELWSHCTRLERLEIDWRSDSETSPIWVPDGPRISLPFLERLYIRTHVCIAAYILTSFTAPKLDVLVCYDEYYGAIQMVFFSNALVRIYLVHNILLLILGCLQ